MGSAEQRHSMLVWLWIVYTALLVYGTWFPMDNWDGSIGGLMAFLSMGWPSGVPFTDALLNIFVYIPFGFLAMLCLPWPAGKRLLLTTAAGAALCSALELGQTYLPGRVTSPVDIILNTTGTLLGATIAGLVPRLPYIQRMQRALWSALRDPGVGRLGLLALALWALSQWTPLVPSLDLGNIRSGLAPLKASLMDGAPFIWSRYIEYLLMFLGVGILGLAVLKPSGKHTLCVVAALLAVLAVKILMVGRVLSSEALLACITDIPLLLLLRNRRSEQLRLVALASLVTFYCFDALVPAPIDTSLRSLNWVPFRGHLNSVHGIFNLLEQVWLFVAIAYTLARPLGPDRATRIVHGIFLFVLVMLIEWSQQFVPGRYPDMTDVVVAIGAWWLAGKWPWHLVAEQAAPEEPTPSLKGQSRNIQYILISGLVIAVIVTTFLFDGPPADNRESGYSLPTPALLPEPAFVQFRHDHPRLPAPSASEIDRISENNPKYWQRQRKAADKGKLDARILMARVEPGSVNLKQLHDDLLQLKPSWRGHSQAKPLALAYDWLHDYWTLDQRQSLLLKVEEACQYQIYAIREKYELSPYNVYLYNSAVQALMMVALASHMDSTDDSCMRFTADYWRNRVIPVWRQIMGVNGGWHEGGEYVGIGIGQAIYSLPAMWRHATGEDFFATEPGIRGFLDFAVYRTRPDGTHMRLGDAAYFKRGIPDLAALAIEYQHSAAYTLAKTPDRIEPVIKPWGPLAQPSLEDEDAVNALPLYHYFDGIGLLIARSDWGPDATWVSFKAGNNYWSHSHLDQGAFTIFKGGPLAIDSGLYGTKYGADHHMNYTYQSIAHNVVTVTDPADDLDMPPRKDDQSYRQIANDGGQRRVGSGWGRSAPMDYLQWIQEADHYQTVGKTLWNESEGMLWKVADLTPAYTNRNSGKGYFAERTRRVEQYQRSFAFLRELDLIIVYDRIDTSDPEFTQRWLLHGLHKPQVHGRTFEFAVPPKPKRGMAGGRLQGQVLLPTEPVIQSIGGPGQEFLVNGRNYDEDGAVQKRIAKKKYVEPGQWRLEISPRQKIRSSEYLVVMQASTLDKPASFPSLRVQRDENNIKLFIESQDTLEISIPRSLGPLKLKRNEH